MKALNSKIYPALSIITSLFIFAVLTLSCNDPQTSEKELPKNESDIRFGNDMSNESVISADGRFVTFQSKATNLIPADTNGVVDIFIKDLTNGNIRLVSVGTSGEQGDQNSYHPSISGDGRFVTFSSEATNLVSDDTNHEADIFVKDMQTGSLTMVSRNSDGEQGNGFSEYSSITSDGRYISFQSTSSNFSAGHTSQLAEVYVKDLLNGRLTVASRDSGNNPGNSDCIWPSISSDGRFIAFDSAASNLVFGDTNRVPDVFVKDVQSGSLKRISTDSSDAQSNESSSEGGYIAISTDGRYVAFSSSSTNLIKGLGSELNVFQKDTKTGELKLISASAKGVPGNRRSGMISMSGDGRYVVFQSEASNLIDGDNNRTYDIYLKDALTGGIKRVSESGNGEETNGKSLKPSISADSRYVTFDSSASNLVSGKDNEADQVYVKDILTGAIRLVSGIENSS